jgi:hypothetical protein
MADIAKINYSGSLTIAEVLEALDTTQSSSLMHSKIDKTLGGSIEKQLDNVSAIVYKSSQTVNSTSYLDMDDSATYEGFTWSDGATINIDFFFCRIIEPVTTGQTPSVIITLDAGTTSHIKLTGINDFCIIPLDNYAVQVDPNWKLKFKAAGSSNFAKVEWLVVKV